MWFCSDSLLVQNWSETLIIVLEISFLEAPEPKRVVCSSIVQTTESSLTYFIPKMYVGQKKLFANLSSSAQTTHHVMAKFSLNIMYFGSTYIYMRNDFDKFEKSTPFWTTPPPTPNRFLRLQQFLLYVLVLKKFIGSFTVNKKMLRY